MEIEFFVNPHEHDRRPPADEDWHDRWIERLPGVVHALRPGARRTCKLHEHARDELAHYAKRTVDILYEFPMGWSELMGIANRTDFDLKQHAKFSGKSLTWFDEERKEHVVPFVIEPSAGVDRALLAFLLDAYREEEVRGEKRVVLRFHPGAGAGEDRGAAAAQEARRRSSPPATTCAPGWPGAGSRIYDDTAAIGRLYRRQDEVGTPYCVTVDVKTVGDAEKGEAGDQRVTIRERDSMEQIRVPIAELESVFARLLDGTAWRDVAAAYPRAEG